MEGTHTVGPLAGRTVGRFTIRGRRDSKMERTGDTLDRKLDALNAVLPATVLKCTGESGEGRGAVRSPLTGLIHQRSPSPPPSPSRGEGARLPPRAGCRVSGGVGALRPSGCRLAGQSSFRVLCITRWRVYSGESSVEWIGSISGDRKRAGYGRALPRSAGEWTATSRARNSSAKTSPCCRSPWRAWVIISP